MEETGRTNGTGETAKYQEGALKIHRLTTAEVIFSVVGCGIGSEEKYSFCTKPCSSPPGRAAGSCILVYCNRAAHTFFHDVCG